jgi:hypothetical protein
MEWEPEFIISLTTIPSRFPLIGNTIDSLLHQSVEPRKIILNIPRTYNVRFTSSISDTDLEAFSEKYKDTCISIHFVDVDSGPGTKLLGLRDIIGDFYDSTYIILVYDDVVYKPFMIKNYCQKIKQYGILTASHYVYTAVEPCSCVEIPLGQGVDGFLIYIGVLDKFWNYFDLVKNEDFILYDDDTYISYYLYLRSVSIYFLRLKYDYIYNTTHYTDENCLFKLKGKYSRYNVNANVMEILENMKLNGKFENIVSAFEMKKL